MIVPPPKLIVPALVATNAPLEPLFIVLVLVLLSILTVAFSPLAKAPSPSTLTSSLTVTVTSPVPFLTVLPIFSSYISATAILVFLSLSSVPAACAKASTDFTIISVLGCLPALALLESTIVDAV